jgi:hypothetical protein
MITPIEAKNALYVLEQFLKQQYLLETSGSAPTTTASLIPMSDKQRDLIANWVNDNKGVYPIGFKDMDIMKASDFISKNISQEYIIARRNLKYPRRW